MAAVIDARFVGDHAEQDATRGGEVGPAAQTRGKAVAQESDHEQFMALLEADGGALMGLLRRLCGNQPDADDVFQETAVRVWKNFSSRPWLRNPRSWLMTIGYRAFLDLQTRRPRGEPLLDPPDASASLPRELVEKAEDCDRDAAPWAGEPLCPY